ncbi:ATP-binding protein [Nevskia sp.]|uniref:ATP-binding protein n=1 Tax=Nevskia sp. TaxID=1929292 RepID=UPI003F705ADE
MSLKRALLLRLLAPVALLLVISSILAYRLTLRYADRIYDSWLYDLAHTVSLEVGEDGPETVHTGEIDKQLRTWKTGDSEVYLITSAGRRIAGDEALRAADAQGQRYADDARVADLARGAQVLRVMHLAVPANERHGALEVRVAQDLAVRYELADEILYAVSLPAALLILIAFLLTGRAVRASLRGIDELTQRLCHHPEGRPFAIETGQLPKELRGLTVAFASLVKRNGLLLKAQQQFIANAAHQLRGPMAATELHLDGIERAVDDAERQRSMAQLRRSIERSRRLTQQLLSLARLEPGSRPPLPLRTLDLGETVRAAGAEYVPLAINRGIDVTLDLPSTPALITGHALLLQEALSNLIDNAVRYHPGHGLIEMAVTIDGERALLTVRDDGPGVDPELAPRLFTRFARADDSHHDGAGLGLAIVREIVDLHHGEVRAGPGEGGKGLCVEIALPIAEPAGGEAPSA